VNGATCTGGGRKEKMVEISVIERLITEHGRDIYSFCVYLTGDRTVADDLYQQTFLVAMEKGGIDETNNPKSYLLGIAVNINNNRRRKEIRRQSKIGNADFDLAEEAYNVAADQEPVEDEIYKRERNKAVRLEVLKLPDKLRDVVLLFYTEQLQVQEIAQVLKISEGTVKSRLHNARKILRERLQKYADE
jgi:RNA polymerase sigma-70 factor (ECF subfamily)